MIVIYLLLCLTFPYACQLVKQNPVPQFKNSHGNIDQYLFEEPQKTINVRDSTVATCRCSSGIFCYGFDYLTANPTTTSPQLHMMLPGEFYLYQSTVQGRNFQVEVRTKHCLEGFCICGVASREQQDAVIIDACLSQYVSLTERTGSYVRVDHNSAGNEFTITFPSGAKVIVNGNSSSLSVIVGAPALDFGHTLGLCGTLDGNTNNDFNRKDGNIDPQSNKAPTEFIESWRIPLGTSIFDQFHTFGPIGRRSIVNISQNKTESTEHRTQDQVVHTQSHIRSTLTNRNLTRIQ